MVTQVFNNNLLVWRRLTFLLSLLLCVGFAWAGEPTSSDQQTQNLCALRFDCEGVQFVSIRNLSQDNQSWTDKELQAGALLLPQGEYEIRYVIFECGLEVDFKYKRALFCKLTYLPRGIIYLKGFFEFMLTEFL